MTMNDDDLSRLIREHASRHGAGDALRAAVRTQAALQDAARAAPEHRQRRRWLAAALPAAVGGVVVGIAATLAVQAWRAEPAAVVEALVDGHVRALRDGPLFEVASSDRHTVKPWFQGRLDYAPPVPDDLPGGFRLLGGRVETVQGRPTAALVYQLRLHKIDLYVWPAAQAAAPERLQRRGFSIAHWSEGAMQFWAVSDMDGAELERFGAAWRAAASP